MIIDRINKTNDVKKLNKQEKISLANEIRQIIINTVSKNGGHLASNLGVVELTIALECVFDLNNDKIIWDVGHQCYTHKILNNRKKQFNTIRKQEGISGFPKITESKTDCFNTGHSSTSISAAMGIAAARNIKKEDYNVIAVIGDGALTGGMALEALNHVGCTQTKIIIVLNDNEMSISKNISGINTLLTKLRSKKKYRKTNKKGKKMISSLPFIGNLITKSVKKSKNVIKQVFVPGMYFEEIGIKYLGPIDGHNIQELEEVFTHAKNFEEPVLIHVITKKGKGYSYAEDNPSKYHGVSPFNIGTGIKEKNSKNYSLIFGKKLISMAKTNKKIVAITAAMRDGVGLTNFSKKYPNRFFDVGIAEQHALTFAAGLSSNGLIPFVSIYSSFYQRAYDQIIHDICIQELPLIMCVDRSGIVGEDGETHQGLYDFAFFRLIPNLVIMAPKNYKELENMMEFSIKIKKPVVIRYPKGSESSIEMSNQKITLGKSEILKRGNQLTFIAIGKTVSKAVSLAEKLEKIQIKSEVINCRFLKPFDQDTVLKSIKRTKKVVVMEDGTILNGLSTTIKEIIADNNLQVKAKYYAYPDCFIKQGKVSDIEKKYKIDNDSIYKDLIKMLNPKK